MPEEVWTRRQGSRRGDTGVRGARRGVSEVPDVSTVFLLRRRLQDALCQGCLLLALLAGCLGGTRLDGAARLCRSKSTRAALRVR